MRNFKLTGSVVPLLLTVLLYAQNDQKFVTLPKGEALQIAHLCSRPAPKVEGGWQPSTVDTIALDSRLTLISKLESGSGLVGIHISHPERYYRQYVGVVVKGRKLIYVNAFLPDKPPADWHEHLASYCDGGSTFWGVVYDPKTQQFSELSTNGIA